MLVSTPNTKPQALSPTLRLLYPDALVEFHARVILNTSFSSPPPPPPPTPPLACICESLGVGVYAHMHVFLHISARSLAALEIGMSTQENSCSTSESLSAFDEPDWGYQTMSTRSWLMRS